MGGRTEEAVPVLPTLAPESVATMLTAMLRTGASWPPDESTDGSKQVLQSLRGMGLADVLQVIQLTSSHLERANMRHGLTYVSRDCHWRWQLDGDSVAAPPTGAELVVLEALLRFVHARVLNWVADAPTGGHQ